MDTVVCWDCRTSLPHGGRECDEANSGIPRAVAMGCGVTLCGACLTEHRAKGRHKARGL